MSDLSTSPTDRADEGRPEIIVIGFGVARKSGSGYMTRRAIAEYLSELAQYGRVTWLTSSKADDVADLSENLPPEIQVELINGKNPFANSMHLWQRRNVAGVIAAYPMALRVWPALLWSLAGKTVFYVGNDFTEKPRVWKGVADRVLWHHRYVVAKLLSAGCKTVAARGRHLAEVLRKTNRNTFETVPITMRMSSDEVEGSEREASKPYLLYVGKLIEEKGIALLVDCYRKAEWTGEKPDLFIVGSGALTPEIADAARVDESIFLLGYLNDPTKLASLYREASALILPTLAEWEGVPRVLSEARSFGTPVYVTPLKSIQAEFGADVWYIDWPVLPRKFAAQLAEIPLYRGRRIGSMEGAGAAARQHYYALGMSDAEKGI